MIDQDWAFSHLTDVALVDAPSGTILATDLDWDPNEIRFAWRVECGPGEFVCRAAIAHGPLLPDAVAAIDVRLSDSVEVEWDSLRSNMAHGRFTSEWGFFGVFDAEMLESVYWDQEFSGPNQFEHLNDLAAEMATTHPAFRQFEFRGTKCVGMGCTTQHPEISSWMSRDADGSPVRIASSFEILDIDPIRDGRLPWD